MTIHLQPVHRRLTSTDTAEPLVDRPPVVRWSASVAALPADVSRRDAAGTVVPLGRGDATHTENRAARRAEVRRRLTNARVLRRPWDPGSDREAGMATAEYAIATLAAVGFAALLVAVLSSGEVKGLLMSLITSALNFG